MALFHVFVYGTLKPGERAYGTFCQPYVLEARPAIAQGRLYALPEGYPAMTQEPGWVQGYRLSFSDRTLIQVLDEFEDYFPDHPEESFYQRLEVSIFSPEQRALGTAWAYIMHPQQINQLGGQSLPAGIWTELS